MNEAAARLIDRIETTLKVTDAPGFEMKFTMDRDAAHAFVDHLRTTDHLLSEYTALRKAAQDYLDYCMTATKLNPLNMSVVRQKRAALRAAIGDQQTGSDSK